ncbi:MAG: hypothetical protein GDA47_04935 [Rhodospirillales bacterium]|nr:hypothetical protein [Rhodospirillales bacterium]
MVGTYYEGPAVGDILQGDATVVLPDKGIFAGVIGEVDVTFSGIKNISNPDGLAPDDIDFRNSNLRILRVVTEHDNTYWNFTSNGGYLEGVFYGEDAGVTAGTFQYGGLSNRDDDHRVIGAYGARKVSN